MEEACLQVGINEVGAGLAAEHFWTSSASSQRAAPQAAAQRQWGDAAWRAADAPSHTVVGLYADRRVITWFEWNPASAGVSGKIPVDFYGKK